MVRGPLPDGRRTLITWQTVNTNLWSNGRSVAKATLVPVTVAESGDYRVTAVVRHDPDGPGPEKERGLSVDATVALSGGGGEPLTASDIEIDLVSLTPGKALTLTVIPPSSGLETGSTATLHRVTVRGPDNRPVRTNSGATLYANGSGSSVTLSAKAPNAGAGTYQAYVVVRYDSDGDGPEKYKNISMTATINVPWVP